MKKYIVLVLAVLMLLTACGSVTPKRAENEIVRDLVQSYGKHQSLDLGLVAELEAVNTDSAKLWCDVISYWDEANSMTVPECLREGIENPEKLCIVVLGFQLNPDGSMRDELLGRLNTALACAQQYPHAYVLCTGGGTAAQTPSATEAGTMAQWLIDNGVSPERVIVEDRSLSTVQNAQFSREILHSSYPEVSRVAIVTSDYHVPWGAVLFQTEFLLKGENIAVTDYAGFITENPGYSVISYQTSGIMELAGIR